MNFRKSLAFGLVSILSFLPGCEKDEGREVVKGTFGRYSYKYSDVGDSISFTANLVEESGIGSGRLNPRKIAIMDNWADGRIDTLNITFPEGIESRFVRVEDPGNSLTHYDLPIQFKLSYDSSDPGMEGEELERFLRTAISVYGFVYQSEIRGSRTQ